MYMAQIIVVISISLLGQFNVFVGGTQNIAAFVVAVVLWAIGWHFYDSIVRREVVECIKEKIKKRWIDADNRRDWPYVNACEDIADDVDEIR